MQCRFPLLEGIANKRVIWKSVTCVGAECSFSRYKHLLNNQHESLTLENTKKLTVLFYNGDLKRFDDYNLLTNLSSIDISTGDKLFDLKFGLMFNLFLILIFFYHDSIRIYSCFVRFLPKFLTCSIIFWDWIYLLLIL